MLWMWITAAAAAVWVCIRSVYERKVFTTDTYELRSEKVTREHTFVFLTDLHDNCFGSGQRRLLAAIGRVKPEAVLIGGDMVTAREGVQIETAASLIKELAGRYPVFCGNGNHENRMKRDRARYGDAFSRYLRELTEAGVTYLGNAGAAIDDEVFVSGLDLAQRYYRHRNAAQLDEAYITRRLGAADPARYQILLAHSPKYADAYGKWGADLALCGHYHGGIIWIPGLGGLMSTQFELFCRKCQGLHEKDGHAMIVGRGLGTHSVNLRLNNISQLVVVKIKPQEISTEG